MEANDQTAKEYVYVHTPSETSILTRSSKNKTPDTATKPVVESKPREDLAVVDLANYYATTKPPGRKFPASMADDMINMFVDEEAVPPAPEEPKELPQKKARTVRRKRKCKYFLWHFLYQC
jgi:hypothetical protein